MDGQTAGRISLTRDPSVHKEPIIGSRPRLRELSSFSGGKLLWEVRPGSGATFRYHFSTGPARVCRSPRALRESIFLENIRRTENVAPASPLNRSVVYVRGFRHCLRASETSPSFHSFKRFFNNPHDDPVLRATRGRTRPHRMPLGSVKQVLCEAPRPSLPFRRLSPAGRTGAIHTLGAIALPRPNSRSTEPDCSCLDVPTRLTRTRKPLGRHGLRAGDTPTFRSG